MQSQSLGFGNKGQCLGPSDTSLGELGKESIRLPGCVETKGTTLKTQMEDSWLPTLWGTGVHRERFRLSPMLQVTTIVGNQGFLPVSERYPLGGWVFAGAPFKCFSVCLFVDLQERR